MTVVNGNILRVAARLNNPEHGDSTNVFHFKAVLTADQTDAAVLAACADYCEDIYGPIKNHIVDNYNFADINVFNVTQNKPLGVALWPTYVKGGDTGGEMMAPQVAAFVRATTGYPRNWAKKFFGGLGEGVCTDTGFVSSALLVNLAVLGAAWLTPWVFGTTEGLQAVVYHRSAAVWRELEEVVVRNVWSTIRTRRAGRGS